MFSLLRPENTQPMVYWAPSTSASFGTIRFERPVKIYGHYEEMLMRVNVEGTQVESQAMACIKDVDVEVGGLLLATESESQADRIVAEANEDMVESPFDVEGTRTPPESWQETARRILKYKRTPGISKNPRVFERMAMM